MSTRMWIYSIVDRIASLQLHVQTALAGRTILEHLRFFPTCARSMRTTDRETATSRHPAANVQRVTCLCNSVQEQ